MLEYFDKIFQNNQKAFGWTFNLAWTEWMVGICGPLQTDMNQAALTITGLRHMKMIE